MLENSAHEGGVGMVNRFEIFGVPNFPDVVPGTDLSEAIVNCFAAADDLKDLDIIVVASKIVSKSEDMYRKTDDVVVSDEAQRLHVVTGKPEKICQIVIDESQKVWTNGTALLALHKQGFELSSAGVDRLNDDLVILLPRDPDKSAETISKGIFIRTSKRVAVVISDSHGRADREGAGAVALGVYGIDPLRITMTTQTGGRTKKADETLCDMIAAGAAIIMGQRGRGMPVVCVRGIPFTFNVNANVKSILHHAPR